MTGLEAIDSLDEWIGMQLDALRESSFDDVKNAAFQAYFQTQKVVSKLRKELHNGS